MEKRRKVKVNQSTKSKVKEEAKTEEILNGPTHYHLNPMYTIKECSSCGALYNKSCDCSKGGFIDKFVRDPNKTPDSSQRPPHNCHKCGNPVDGLYCRQCALLRKKLNEDPGKNSSQCPPHIYHYCYYGCGDSLDGIFCQRCTCESYGNSAHIGYNCPLKVPIISNPKPCHNQNTDEFPQTMPSFHLTCYSGDENSFAYDSTPIFVDDSPNDRVSEIKDAFGNKQYNPEDMQELFCKLLNDVQNILKELAEYINTPSWNRPAFYNNEKDDDEDYTIAITAEFMITDSLSMRDDHLSTIPEKESDEFINDDESFSDEDVSKEIYSNPLFNEEIISIKIDPHHFNAKSDLIESLLNQDSSIISSSKIDSLLDEFAGELIFLKSIPPGIDEADCDPEKEIRLIEKLLNDNSSPRPMEEFNSKNSDAIIESFSLYSIPVEDSDSFMEEIDLSLTLDGSMSPGIENDEYDSEGDILFLEDLLSNYSLSLPENESIHFDIPSSPRPPVKLPDDGIYFDDKPVRAIFTVKVVGDISEHYVLMPRLLPTQPTLASNEEKSPHLLSHRGFKAFQLSSKSPMMIYRGNIPILDVLFLHFYPP
nr:hypothetical protein [Tanacetum cinerariifolium]